MGGRLAGKVALVAGAGTAGSGWGNGKATAVLFAREGARIVAGDLNLEAAEETAEIIRREGGEALAVHVDVSDERSVSALIAQAIDRFGQIDVLHNNVGILAAGGPETVPNEDWHRVFAVNLDGALFLCRYGVPHMRRAGRGSIINVSSIAGCRHLGPDYIAYPASKAALTQFTKVLAAQLGPSGIRCNAILPGFIRTPMVERQVLAALGADPDDRAALEAYYEKRCRQIPLGRMGSAWDVANAALFLASDESAYVSGLELVVDGAVTLNLG